jgi:hypothetical protein
MPSHKSRVIFVGEGLGEAVGDRVDQSGKDRRAGQRIAFGSKVAVGELSKGLSCSNRTVISCSRISIKPISVVSGWLSLPRFRGRLLA